MTWNSQHKRSSELEDFYNYKFNENKMTSGIFTLDWVSIKSAIVTGILTAVLGIGAYIIGVGDIFNLDFHKLANVGALAGITTIVALIQKFLTSSEGKVAGIKVE